MRVKTPAGLVVAALGVFLGSCSMFETDKPLFGDDNNRYQFFPLAHDKNIANPIYPTDKIKTEAQAVELGRRNCGNEAADIDHWYANRAGDDWVVRWNVGQNSIYAKVKKSDGTFDACEVDDPGH